MASNVYWLCMSGLCDDTRIARGHAMPFGLTSLKPTDGVRGRICLTPIEFGVQGVSVPISRGSPPTFT
jgi:hypothetical protein